MPVRLVFTSTDKGEAAAGSATRMEITLVREEVAVDDGGRVVTDPESID